MEKGSNHTWVGDPPPWATLFDENNKESPAILAAVISDVLEKLLEANEELPTPRTITRFNSLKPPAISVRGYLERIMKYAPCSRQCFVLALVYMDRIVECNPTFQLTTFNIHRLLITSVLVASKFFDDLFFNNTYFSKVGGVSVRELDGLELELLFLCNWRLHVLPSTFADYCTQLLKRAPTQQSPAGAATLRTPGSPYASKPAPPSPSGSRPISIPGRAGAESNETTQRGRDDTPKRRPQPAIRPGNILMHVATSDDSDDSTSSGDTEYEDSHSYSEPTPAPPRLRPTPRSNSPSPFMAAMQRAGRFSGVQSGDSEEDSPTRKKVGGSLGYHRNLSSGSDGMHGMCEGISGDDESESDGRVGEVGPGREGLKGRHGQTTPGNLVRKTPDIFHVETDDLADDMQKVHIEGTTDGPP